MSLICLAYNDVLNDSINSNRVPALIRTRTRSKFTIPDFSNLLNEKRKLVREIGKFEKPGVKLQCLTNWNRSKRNDF